MSQIINNEHGLILKNSIMTERELLIRAYEGISEIPIKHFAKMINCSYNTVRNKFSSQIKKTEHGYIVVRNLRNPATNTNPVKLINYRQTIQIVEGTITIKIV